MRELRSGRGSGGEKSESFDILIVPSSLPFPCLKSLPWASRSDTMMGKLCTVDPSSLSAPPVSTLLVHQANPLFEISPCSSKKHATVPFNNAAMLLEQKCNCRQTNKRNNWHLTDCTHVLVFLVKVIKNNDHHCSKNSTPCLLVG